MTSANFNLRGVNLKVMDMLRQEAERQDTSVNTVILKCIEQGVGYSHKIDKPTYHDLDDLAGTWNKEDARIFEENTKFFEKIDKDLWS